MQFKKKKKVEHREEKKQTFGTLISDIHQGLSNVFVEAVLKEVVAKIL